MPNLENLGWRIDAAAANGEENLDARGQVEFELRFLARRLARRVADQHSFGSQSATLLASLTLLDLAERFGMERLQIVDAATNRAGYLTATDFVPDKPQE